eukprot:UN05455
MLQNTNHYHHKSNAAMSSLHKNYYEKQYRNTLIQYLTLTSNNHHHQTYQSNLSPVNKQNKYE